MEKMSYKLNDFEGPIELLLHLIKKNKLNIYDVQISELLAQYLSHIEHMKVQDMEVSSEFLEMAARLIYIKTAMLLPKHEEAESLKQELTGQLLEYEQYQRMAKVLEKEMNFGLIARPPQEITPDRTYSIQHKGSALIKAYTDVIGRKASKMPPSKEVFSQIVSRKIVSVFSKVIFVLRKLKALNAADYSSLFSGRQTKSEMVATFLAVLELIKTKRIVLDDENKTIKLLKVGAKVGSKKS